MEVEYKDGSKDVITAGQTYLVGPNHRPNIPGPDQAVMVEFSDSTAKIIEQVSKPVQKKTPSCVTM